MSTPALTLRFPLSAPPDAAVPTSLPPVLGGAAARGGAGAALLPNVRAVATWELAQTSRSGTAPQSAQTAADQRLLALEAVDGTTIFIRADALAERVARLRPEALGREGEVDLDLLRDPEATSRGLGDWLWRRVSALEVEPDAIGELARKKFLDLIRANALASLEDEAVSMASTWGAKALMAAIEDKLAGEEGLYQWRGTPLGRADLCRPGDPRLAGWAGRPALVFIHGTGSHTLASFGDLPGSEEWRALAALYGDRVFAFEHRSFSQGPIDNALLLAGSLPQGATIHLLTHSRGGLVGDLLCVGGGAEERARLVGEFRRLPGPQEARREQEFPALRQAREAVAAEEQAKLHELLRLLDDKDIKVERYVRVACPAAGTALLSDNLDVFISGLLELVRRGGSWAAGAVAGTLAGALSGGGAASAGGLAREAFDTGLRLLARVAVEIAARRVEPQLVPGIEAMLPQSPLGSFLARAPRHAGVKMAAIAGDSEGGGSLKRIVITFTDWMFFERADNDLVVDTASMYAGIAVRGAHALFDQGPEVDHFSYFRNRRTRSAVRAWLADPDPRKLPEWEEIEACAAGLPELSRAAAPTPADRPLLIYLPGIMGSQLEIGRRDRNQPGSGLRVWLDPLELARGGLARIASGQEAWADGLVELAYGRLARSLEKSHRVVRFAYDWRLGIEAAAEQLEIVVQEALDRHPDQPLRILAHSMGGLVVRLLIARKPALWDEIVRRDGGRLVFLGTPNHGSHRMVETLLGRSCMIRTLARCDLQNDLQTVLDIVGGFPGALQLLPRPGFRDSGSDSGGNADTPDDYFDPALWERLAAINDDFWFGSQLGARPSAVTLAQGRAFWEEVAKPIANPERIAYVFGQADNTPCGLKLRKGRDGEPVGLAMLGTAHGDGSVTWASGRLDWLPEERCWLMPVDHAGLVNSADYFDEIEALLASGRASRLARLPTARDAVAPTRSYQPGPPPGYPSAAELVSAVIGGQVRVRRPQQKRAELKVLARAGDLRDLPIPVLCGHYIDDPIAGAEWVIDRDLVNGALGNRERLGVHAGACGTASVVLMPRTTEERLRGTGKGALVVGLGEFGQLTAEDLRETVRAGVLRLLLHAADRLVEQGGAADPAALELRLASLLIGYNSTTSISVEESVAAITLGVAEANRQFAERSGGGLATRVGSLEFIEQYQDVAISCAHAVRALPKTQERALKALGVRLSVADELIDGEGVRPRLSVGVASNYWPRLIVSDGSAAPGAVQGYPERLKYLHLSERARAEAQLQQSQPGLIEKLVQAEISQTFFSAENGFSRTLYQLLVPLSFRSVLREAANLMLVVDPGTAKLPWEMLVADGQPLVLQTRLVRQLATGTYRQAPRSTRELSAYVVANPSTAGYQSEFNPDWQPGTMDRDYLPDLAGAEEEGGTIAALLERSGYQVERSARKGKASEVIYGLFKRPYRVLVLSGHGMYAVRDRHGEPRSGLVLSDGLMLTAAEVQQMEVVPELVFLSCCHLGSISGEANKLAYSLARELIEMGVRCVVAAGWEVDDAAARTFATTFFDEFVNGRQTFAEALLRARKACHALHPERNTWGAYQAYGDPTFTLGQRADEVAPERIPVAPGELVDWLDNRRLAIGHKSDAKADYHKLAAEIRRRLAAVPAPWLGRADVQFALAGLYAALGDEGFADARTAYLAAIAADSSETPGASAPLAAIEQLANLEARSAEKLARRRTGDASQRIAQLDEAAKLVARAIRRINHLLEVSADEGAARGNQERWSVLASAHKIEAVVLHEGGGGWAELRGKFEQARAAYAQGEGDPAAPDFDPYAVINRLQLEALLDQPAPNFRQLVDRCQQVARRRFAEGFKFWDAIKAVDARLAGWLLGADDAGGEVDELARRFASDYRQEVEELAPEPREFDSVVRQIDFLAEMFEKKAGAAGEADRTRIDALRAGVLRGIARRLKEPAESDAAPATEQ